MAEVVRPRFREAAQAEITLEKLRESLRQAFDSNKRYTCAHCHRVNSVPMPDISAIAKILDQVDGPLAAPDQVVNHHVLVTAMSLDEKAVLLAEYRERQAVLEAGVGSAV